MTGNRADDAGRGRLQADTLSPGTQLAGRYRIEDLVGETPRSQTWRALDRILNRSVSVQVVPGDDDGSEAFLTAARAATAVEDPRFLRVLDAAREDGFAYVVREWARGVALDTVLREGPLPTRRAAEVVREVAEALASAHRVGVQHGRLEPARILVKHNGAVRVLGLATDQALHAPVHAPVLVPAPRQEATHQPDEDTEELPEQSPSAAVEQPPDEPTEPRINRPTDRPTDRPPDWQGWQPAASNGSGERDGGTVSEQADVTALGRVLYACLVARWPGGRDVGLPAAPTEQGRLLRPSQVRAGVDPVANGIVDRILGTPPRHHVPPLRSAADVGRELAALPLAGATAVRAVDDDATMPHGVLPLAPDPAGPPPAIHQVPPPRTAAGPSAATAEQVRPPRHTGARAPVRVGIALLVALAAVLAVVAGRGGSGVLPLGGDDPTTTPSAARATPAIGPVQIAAVTDFDPQGTDGGENPDEVPAAVDGDPSTAWTTSTYFGSSTLGNLKDGVGLLLDLGRARDVTSIDITLLGGPTSLTVYAAPDASAPPSGVAQLTVLGDTRTGPAEPAVAVPASVAPEKPVSTRWLVVWLTDLPPNGAGDYDGQIAELVVVG